MKNILIPTDLSDNTKDTLKYAVKFSLKKVNTKLFFYYSSEEKKAENTIYLKDYIQTVISEIDIEPTQIDIEYISDKGHFSNEQIKKIIKKHSIDLVIICSSHDGFYTTFFGSLFSEMINGARCPILSIPHNYNGFKLDKIGFASELFDLKRRIKLIIPFAKLFNASVEIVHVYPVLPQIVAVEKIKKEKELERIKKENDYDKISFFFIKTTFDNEAVKGILKYINSNNPDLLMLSHKPRGLFDKLALDSGATESVEKKSSVPILVFNKKSISKII